MSFITLPRLIYGRVWKAVRISPREFARNWWTCRKKYAMFPDFSHGQFISIEIPLDAADTQTAAFAISIKVSIKVRKYQYVFFFFFF